MKKYVFALILAIATTNFVLADAGILKSYQKGDWSNLVKTANGMPIAIHFWGVTCPSCIKEMPQWGTFLKAHQNTKVIFIQVDDVSVDSMQKMLAKAGLEKANNFYLAAPFDERLRYEIDPKWQGETPMTIVIDKNGKVTRKTGLMNFQQLQSQLSIGS